MYLSTMFSDGMVLQRDAEVSIWGKAFPSETVTITFQGKQSIVTADSDGKWIVTFGNLDPGGPYEMEFQSSEQTIVLRDVLVGDVWVLGGQSNMELPIRRTLDLYADEMNEVNEPFIRQFAVPQIYDFHSPKQDVSGGTWISAANPEELMAFSAVGFFFARQIYRKCGVPIGLVLTAVGGTPVEAWMSEQTLREFGGYDEELERNKDDAYVAETRRADEQKSAEWYHHLNEIDAGLTERWFSEGFDDSDWEVFNVPNSWAGSTLELIRGAVWFRKEIIVPESMAGQEAQLMLGTIVDADDTYLNGELIGSTAYRYPPRRYGIPKGLLKPGKNVIAVRLVATHNTGEFIKDMPYKLKAGGHELSLEGDWRYLAGAACEAQPPQTFFQYKPSGLYNGMIAPIRNYAIRGFLWYQGESNVGSPQGYAALFERMVADWRSSWGRGELPILYMQLPNFGEPAEPVSIQHDSQWAVLRDEQRRSLRVPNSAMAVGIDAGEYNELHPQNKKVVGERLALCARAIVYGEDIVYSGPAYSRMVKEGSAIRLFFTHIGGGLAARDGVLKGFAVCGADGAYLQADAVIDGDTVLVSCAAVAEPLHVRYAWADNPQATLYNTEGLPAAAFTTEEQPI